MSDIPEKFLEGKAKVVLSESEKSAIKARLLDYIAKNPALSGSAHASSSILQNLINSNYMPIVFALIILFGGGASYVAEGAVPGDAMYSIKTGVNENLKSAFVVGAEANANWEARLVERRLEESAKLDAEGKLDAETESMIASEVESHAEKSQENIAKLEADGKSEQAVAAKARLNQALAVHIDMQAGVKVDNASETAVDVRAKESVISNVVNKLELKLGAPVMLDIKMDGSADLNAGVKSDTGAGQEFKPSASTSGSVSGSGSTSGSASTGSEVKVDSSTSVGGGASF